MYVRSRKVNPSGRGEGKIIEDSCKKSGNQWTIPYPWKPDPSLLPDNRQQAVKRLETTERQLLRNPEYAEAYKQQMKEMEHMNFARKISPEEETRYQGPVHHISHHAVINLRKRVLECELCTTLRPPTRDIASTIIGGKVQICSTTSSE